jgi:hypothetical protein
MVLGGSVDDARSAADGLGWRPAERPVFGTLPIGQFNALALRVLGRHSR